MSDGSPNDGVSTSSSAPVLVASNLTKRYGGVEALVDATIEVHAGEVVALCGENGAGKSTMVGCLCGAITPDSGRIRIEGAEVRFRRPIDAREAGIETVFQTLALADDLTATENLYLGRELMARLGPLKIMNNRQMRRSAADVLARFGLRAFDPNIPVKGLSGGQRQAIAIARAVSLGRTPRVAILDEPTAALGVRERGRVAEIVHHIKTMNLAIILVSHNLEEVFELTDRIYVLRHGRVIQECVTAKTAAADVVSYITGADAVRAQR